jgi:hypothetical protein
MTIAFKELVDAVYSTFQSGTFYIAIQGGLDNIELRFGVFSGAAIACQFGGVIELVAFVAIDSSLQDLTI